MKPRKERKRSVETYAIEVIDLKAEDCAILMAMAKRYKVDALIDLL